MLQGPVCVKFNDAFATLCKTLDQILNDQAVGKMHFNVEKFKEMPELRQLAQSGLDAMWLKDKIDIANKCSKCLDKLTGSNKSSNGAQSPNPAQNMQAVSLMFNGLTANDDLAVQFQYATRFLQENSQFLNFQERLNSFFDKANNFFKNKLIKLIVAAYEKNEQNENQFITMEVSLLQKQILEAIAAKVKLEKRQPTDEQQREQDELARILCEQEIKLLLKSLRSVHERLLKEFSCDNKLFWGNSGQFQQLNFTLVQHRWLRKIYRKSEKLSNEGKMLITYLSPETTELSTFISNEFNIVAEDAQTLEMDKLSDDPFYHIDTENKFISWIFNVLHNFDKFSCDLFGSYGSAIEGAGGNRSFFASIVCELLERFHRYVDMRKTSSEIKNSNDQFDVKFAINFKKIIDINEFSEATLKFYANIHDLHSVLANANMYLKKFLNPGLVQDFSSLASPRISLEALTATPRTRSANIFTQLIFLNSYMDAQLKAVDIISELMQNIKNHTEFSEFDKELQESKEKILEILFAIANCIYPFEAPSDDDSLKDLHKTLTKIKNSMPSIERSTQQVDSLQQSTDAFQKIHIDELLTSTVSPITPTYNKEVNSLSAGSSSPEQQSIPQRTRKGSFPFFNMLKINN